MGAIFKVPAMIIYFAGGLWGLVICLGIVSAKLGIIGLIVGLFIFPAVLYLAPWYAGFADGNWFPVMLIYGTTIASWILFAIGSAIDSERVKADEAHCRSNDRIHGLFVFMGISRGVVTRTRICRCTIWLCARLSPGRSYLWNLGYLPWNSGSDQHLFNLSILFDSPER